MTFIRNAILALSLAAGFTNPALAEEKPARNVIVFITDGAGIESFRAASYYRFGHIGQEVYDRFDVRIFAATYPLNTSNTPTLTNEGSVSFNPAELWDTTPTDTVFERPEGSYPGYFTGYNYARTQTTDSAAAATALASGRKTYNNAINWSNDNEPMRHIGEYVVESGRALGVITSVQVSHATPAGFLAHNTNRNNYAEIGREIVDSGLATVVFGAGHPDYDGAGKFRETPAEEDYRFIGGRESWEKLKVGDTEYQLIETREAFEAFANGSARPEKTKVLGLVQNGFTLQFNRPGVSGGNLLETSPDLPTLTRAALNILGENQKGFFLMVEGGAVDWAAHANNLPRLIEEQIDFNLSVEAAADWIEKNSSWEETLVIVTTDHGNGLLQGPDSNTIAYSPIISQGRGALPLVRWHTDGHTRELIPLFAHGKGADYFKSVARKEDGLSIYNVTEDQKYWVENTDVFRASMRAMGLKE